MRAAACGHAALLLTALLLAPTRAADAGEETAPGVADAVLVAVVAGDSAVLTALAEKELPDPWRVADLLIARGEHDAALAFAEAAPRSAVARLPAYVESRSATGDDTAARKTFGAVSEALAAKHWQDALEQAGSVEGPLDSVVRISLRAAKGHALGKLGRFGPSAEAFGEAGAAALELGWLRGAVTSYADCGQSLWELRDGRSILVAWNKRLEVAKELGDRVQIGRALVSLGALSTQARRPAQAQEYLEAALEIFRDVGSEAGVATVYRRMAHLMQTVQRWKEAMALHRKELEIREKLGDRRQIANAAYNLGGAYITIGPVPQALPLYRRALKLYQEVGDSMGQNKAHHNLALTYQMLGKFHDALEHYQSALELSTASGDLAGVALTHQSLGGIRQFLGQYERAAEEFRASLKVCRELGNQQGIATALGGLAGALSEMGRDEEALEHLQKSYDMTRDYAQPQFRVIGLVNLGNLKNRLGRHEEALADLRQALEICRQAEDPQGTAEALNGMVTSLLYLGREEEALEVCEEAWELVREWPHSWTGMTTFRNLAQFRYLAGRYDEAAAGDTTDRADVQYCLWQATGNRDYLIAAKRILDHLVAHAPEAYRESMLNDVRLNREIMVAWARHGDTAAG